MTVTTGLSRYWPEAPAGTTDLQASKSSTKSAILLAAMSMLMLVLTPDCWPLGVFSATSRPPVGRTALAKGWPAPFSASTRRIWVYLPVGRGICPSSISTPLVRLSRSTLRAGVSTISDQPASASLALLLWWTRTLLTVTWTES
ncbi:hypothetical protein D3C78_1082480 [compost metagenome]